MEASSTEDLLQLARFYDFDLIILSSNLQTHPGNPLFRQMRLAKFSAPVVVLSRGEDQTLKSHFFDSGADDFQDQSIDFQELLSRIRSIVRRSRGFSTSILRTGSIKLNLETKTVDIKNQKISLSTKEYKILELLSLRRGCILSKELILSHLYDELECPNSRVIDVFVCKLRKKLKTGTGGQTYIETVRGEGFVLRDPVIGQCLPKSSAA